MKGIFCCNLFFIVYLTNAVWAKQAKIKIWPKISFYLTLFFLNYFMVYNLSDGHLEKCITSHLELCVAQGITPKFGGNSYDF